jgi:hypothetical protein
MLLFRILAQERWRAKDTHARKRTGAYNIMHIATYTILRLIGKYIISKLVPDRGKHEDVQAK